MCCYSRLLEVIISQYTHFCNRMWTSVRQLVNKGGVKSLFAGILPTYMKTISAIAIVASVTGSLNSYFKKQNVSNAT